MERPIAIETVLAIDEHESGRVSIRPIASLEDGSYGPELDTHAEVELFLSAFLQRSGASTIASFSMVEPVDSAIVEVELPRLDLPRRVWAPLAVAMPCAVLARGKARWVVVLPLGITVYVGPKEELAAVVSKEASRHLGALGLSAHETLQLFPARSHRLVRASIPLDRRAHDRAELDRKRRDDAVQRRDAIRLLEQVARRVRPDDVRGPEPVGVERPLSMLRALLDGKERQSVLLVGDERVGKTELVHAWLRGRGSELDPPLVFATSGAQLIAGMSGFGQWQERLRRSLEAAERLDAVLWLDDLRELMGGRGRMDMAAVFKPWLDEGRVRLIGELTAEAADLFATQQAGLFGTLHPLRIERQDRRAAREALERAMHWAQIHAPHRPTVHESAIATLVEVTDRFLPYRPFPGKAVRLFDELRASAERTHRGVQRPLDGIDAIELFRVQTGIPAYLLRDDVAWRTEEATKFFARRIVGQHEAIARLVGTLAMVKAGLAPGDRPLASLLFAGPTGVGKTALARALAELLFGSAERLIRFDMSELADAGAAERLVRGTESEEGLLTSRVRQQPFCVILLDEIEKAHPAVFDLLLQVLGEGRLTDGRGRTAYFHNAIVVMTSNLGARHRARSVGIDAAPQNDADRFVAAVEAHFRPELVNRIDRIVPFAALDRAQIRAIAKASIDGIAGRRGLTELGVALDVSDASLDRLAEHGYSETYGARALRRHVEDTLVAPLAKTLASLGPLARNAIAMCRTNGEPRPAGQALAEVGIGELQLTLIAGGPGRSARDEQTVIDEVAALRRACAKHLASTTVEELRERASYVVSELAYGDAKRRDETHAALSSELHRLSGSLAGVDAAASELESIEELVLVAALAGENASTLLDDARGAKAQFERALLELLLRRDERHAITLSVAEWDRQRPLDSWLAGLLAFAAARDWQVVAHVHSDSGPRPSDWPAARSWGPPRSVGDMYERLRAPHRDPLTLVLRIRGAYVGVLLALEAGLHRCRAGVFGPEITTFGVRPVAQHTDLQDRDFDRFLLPLRPPDVVHRRLSHAVREHHADKLVIDGRVELLDVAFADRWEHADAVALAHLLTYEGRAEEYPLLFASPLDDARTRADAEEEAAR